ncbi:MAG TPA: shikimate kinase [Burkholderiaceae bacterium]|nr:shikimate kinase [Burkholderiaceae bacterium]
MDNVRDAIFLIGMMGAGKSTVGRLLARELGFEFVDCDREIEARSGVSITTIFELEGEAGFRQREAAVLDELTQRTGVVLATGGGAVLREDNRRHLLARGLVIYLQASADELTRRTSNDRSRPLLQTADPRARIVELLQHREPLYTATAHLIFQSAAANPRRLVKKIMEAPEIRRLRAAA